MKNIYFLVIGMVLMFGMNACNDETDHIIPSKISGLIAEPCEGGVILRWDVPADSNFVYVRVNYQHPVTGEKMKRNVSVYQDTLLINGLLAKDGAYTFDVSSVSLTETTSETSIITATALPVQPTITKQTEKVLLSVDNVYCNNPESSEGPIENLVDGNYSNFFHSSWNKPGTDPHYIDIALPKPVDVFEIKTWYRNGKYGQCPIEITVLGSNDGNQWEVINEMEDDGSGKSTYTTPVLGTEGKTYSHIRYRADRTSDDKVYFALAEMEFYTVHYEIYDPEGIYQPEE